MKMPCTDLRTIHFHWCGFCGARLAFTRDSCRFLNFIPQCPRCGSQDWRDELDDLTAPDYREEPT